jgi:hypothetical protein
MTRPRPGEQTQTEMPPEEQTADGQWLRQLTDINVKLFQQAKNVSRLRRERSLGREEDDPSASSSDSDAMDHGLQLFLDFLRLLRQLHDAGLVCQRAGGSESTSYSQGGHEKSSLPLVLDPASVLVLLSCYMRILRMCADLLGMMEEAVARGSLPPLPRLEVASG